MSNYPNREPFYAHRITRLLFKSCAAQSIGQDAVLLVIHIAHTEDAARYQGPVRFWNSQLNEVLGFARQSRSTTQGTGRLNLVGSTTNAHDRADGRYWTMIPSHVALFNDEPIEPFSIPSTEQERKFVGRFGNGKRNRKVTGNDPLPNPVPVPVPNTHSEAFKKLWDAYPTRNGKKLEKPKAEVEFAKLKADEIPLVMLAVAELLKSGQIPKDCFRWLRNWREWLPDEPVKPAKPKLVGIGKALFKDMEEA